MRDAKPIEQGKEPPRVPHGGDRPRARCRRGAAPTASRASRPSAPRNRNRRPGRPTGGGGEPRRPRAGRGRSKRRRPRRRPTTGMPRDSPGVPIREIVEHHHRCPPRAADAASARPVTAAMSNGAAPAWSAVIRPVRGGIAMIDALPHLSRYYVPLTMPASPMTPGDIPDVTCPFCGLVCDDLVVDADGWPADGAGQRLRTWRSRGSSAPRRAAPARAIAGRACHAGRGGGRGRAAAPGRPPAADRRAWRPTWRARARRGAWPTGCGGVLDHMNSAGALRNTLVLQDSGWITTTLSEVRNRADLLIVAGGDIVSRFPRFFERCIANRETLFGSGPPVRGRLPRARACRPARPSRASRPSVIPCDVTRLQRGVRRAPGAAGGPAAAGDRGGGHAAAASGSRWRSGCRRPATG